MEKLNENKTFVEKYAKILVAFAVFFGALSGSFGSLITAPAIVIGFWRLVIALPFFAIPVLAKETSRKKLFSVSKKSLIWSILSGIFLFAHFYCWFSALKLTNVASAAVLASLHPLVVLFITIFIHKRRVSLKSIIAIIVAIMGGAIIMCSNLSAMLEGGQFEGNLFAFGAAIFMGIYFAIGGKVRQDVEGSVYVLLVFTTCCICFAASTILTATPVIGYPTMDYVYIICLALFCQIGSHAMFNLCMGHVSSLYVSTWEAGDPVFSTLVAIILVRQIPTIIEVIGCVVTVTAILFYNKFERESGRGE